MAFDRTGSVHTCNNKLNRTRICKSDTTLNAEHWLFSTMPHTMNETDYCRINHESLIKSINFGTTMFNSTALIHKFVWLSRCWFYFFFIACANHSNTTLKAINHSCAKCKNNFTFIEWNELIVVFYVFTRLPWFIGHLNHSDIIDLCPVKMGNKVFPSHLNSIQIVGLLNESWRITI